MKRKLLRCVTALSALLLASCSSDPSLSFIPNNDVVGEEMEVTFSISAESATAMTRADGGPGQWQTTIGKGTKIDMLIYAVYEKGKDKNGNDTYTLLKQFGRGIVEYKDDEAESGSTSGNDESKDMSEFLNSPAVKKKNADTYDGQTIMYVGKAFQEDGGDVDITLRLMRNKEYHIAFWAQSSQTAAFDTDRLTAVTVDYEGAKNNDELRDAFCKVESFKVVPSMNLNVVLTRPFAQINVGTTGADYKFILASERKNHAKFTYSEIELEGVSKTINVVTDQIGEGNEQVHFALNRLPAYINMEDIPTNVDGLVQSENEELLKVDLDYDGDVPTTGKEYLTTYPTLDDDGNPKTEEFKYLSMCYVLVPAPTNPSSTDPYTSATLQKLLVTFGTSDDTDKSDDTNKPYTSTISLNNVPVHRNWRTNILCGLYDKEPKEEDPDLDDPTSIYQTPNVYVQLSPAYNGESNGGDGGGGTWAPFGTSGN